MWPLTPTLPRLMLARSCWLPRQALALRPVALPPQSEVRLVEQAVGVPDGAWMRRLQAQLAEAEQERAELQRCD